MAGQIAIHGSIVRCPAPERDVGNPSLNVKVRVAPHSAPEADLCPVFIRTSLEAQSFPALSF
jgi:hypothetical protein